MTELNFKNSWDDSYKNGDNDLIFPSEEIVRLLHKSVFPFLGKAFDGFFSVLDFGCGAGRNAQIFNPKQYSVVGYDLSEVAIEMASKRFPEYQFTFDQNILKSKKYHLVLADSCLDSMPWSDAISSVANIYGSLHSGGFFVLSLLENDLKRDRYSGSDSILVEDEFEKNTVQTYFDQVRIERLLLPLFKIVSMYKVTHTDADGNLIFSRWFISCQAN